MYIVVGALEFQSCGEAINRDGYIVTWLHSVMWVCLCIHCSRNTVMAHVHIVYISIQACFLSFFYNPYNNILVSRKSCLSRDSLQNVATLALPSYCSTLYIKDDLELLRLYV